MDIVNACAERESLGGGQYRSVLHIKPVAFLQDGAYVRSNHDWADGDAQFPHVVSRAPILVYTAPDGFRRICPTRETDRYIEIGAPLVKVAGVWTKPNFGTATRTANRITWHNPNADMSVTMAGHYLKADIELLGGYVPADRQFAFPVGMSGLTRDGGRILRDGVEVMHLRAPDLYDAAAPDGGRLPITSQFVTVGGNPYILFTLPAGVTGMTRPVVDPAFEAQPDAAAGIDTYLDSGNATINYGSFSTLYVRSNRSGLLRMIAQSVPAGATCNSATLTMTAISTPGVDQTISVYAIASANGNWVEGTKGGLIAAAGEPCWNAKEADGSGGVTTAWAGSAGLSTSGTDYVAAALGSFAFGTAHSAGDQLSTTLTAATVQSWFGEATNDGLLQWGTSATTAGAGMASSDHATASYRPKLTVEYTTGGVVTRRSLLGVGW